MTSSYTKNELFALYQIIGLNSSQRTLKSKLENDLLKYLSNNPGDTQKDQRSQDFVASHQDEDTTSTEEELEEPTKVNSSQSQSSDSVDDSERTYVETATNTVDKAEPAIEKKAKNVRFELKPVAHSVCTLWHSFQGHVSTVVTANLIISATEYASAAYFYWPRSLSGSFLFDTDLLLNSSYLSLFNFSYTVLPALLVSFVLNFTKKSSIRRKKHVYNFDPVVFGLVRLVASGIVFSATPYPYLAGISGLTSALIGIYASVLQTP